MARSQSRKRYTRGYDSAESTRYPGTSHTWDWGGSWPSGSGSVFDPTTIFDGGEEGVLYDFGDSVTLGVSQGDAITSVDDLSPNGNTISQGTAARQPKFSGVPTAVGSELVTNPRFTSDTSWTKGTGWTIGSGVATKTAGTASSLSQAISLTAGNLYIIHFNATRTAGTLQLRFTGGTDVTGYAFNENRSHTELFIAVTGNTTLELYGDASFAGTVASISCKQASATTFDGARFDGVNNFLQTAAIDMSATNTLTFGASYWRDDRVGTVQLFEVGEYVSAAQTGAVRYITSTPNIAARDAGASSVGLDVGLLAGNTSRRTTTMISTCDFSQGTVGGQFDAKMSGADIADVTSGSALTVSALPNGKITIGAANNGGFDARVTVHKFFAINRTLTSQELDDMDDWLSSSAPRIAVLGDSTVAPNRISAGQDGESWGVTAMMGDAEAYRGDISEPGETIAQQKTRWQALTSSDYASFDAVFIQAGINDANTYPTTKASSLIIADLQDLVDTVAADVSASCKIYICALTPAKTWLGTVATSPSEYEHWQALNEAIEGGGATPITGVDARITGKNGTANFWDDLNDGSDDLLDIYDHNGDDVHPSNEARWIIAKEWRDQLVADGLI